MKRGGWSWIVGTVLAVHVAVFWMIADKKVLPQKAPVAPPNFSGREKILVDGETGETVRYREFTVSTTLAQPASRTNQTP